MEKRLFREISVPLEEIALRSVVVNLWNNTLNSYWLFRDNVIIVGDKIKQRILEMVPPLFKNRMISLVMPIGAEILSWRMYHEKNFHGVPEDISSDYLKHLHWTSKGTIDYKKTAEKLIDLKMFDVTKRYELACLHCLEDYIPLLWEEVSEEYKKLLKEEFYSSVDMQLKYYWAYVLKGEEYKFNCIFQTRLPGELSFHQYAFKVSAVKGNKSAAKFFFQKLSTRERDSSLLFTIYSVLNERCRSGKKLPDFPKQNLSDVLCYLLSLMSHEQQMQALKNFPSPILACFLDWPSNDFFLEVADVIWTFLPERMYACLLTYMYKVIRTTHVYNPLLFQQFFRQSPRSFRKEFVDKECLFGYFFPEFFSMQDIETIEVIFRNIDAADRVRLIFGQHVFKLLCNSIFTVRWHMVEVLLREAMLSKEDRQRLKKNILKCMTKTHKGMGVEERTHKRKWFCVFFDDVCANAAGEENPKDETSTGVKKLCTEKKNN
ncbi:uncharacterized protein LOC129958709 [Argiope bruennichi]|uniref:Uncharacterized protein n=1 Tax=Argiope bruennichi TaxID=94029 RepID=A0A8T0F1P6_ARGBR|nr:uncharacterized protein LOC129958709 [Argiope bruennichi]KAF8785054.1 hypothetical protein HNY73_010649 [Argiope bruennichi]